MTQLSTPEFEGNWDRVQSRLRAKLGDDVYDSWFGRVEPESVNAGVLKLSVPTRFLQKWLESHYETQLLDCCNAEIPDIAKLEFRVRGPHDNFVRQSPEIELEAVAKQHEKQRKGVLRGKIAPRTDGRTGCDGYEGSPLEPRFAFDTFVTGASNRMAHAAACQVAEATFDIPPRFNPLFIHAGVGLGKTHILHAIAWEVKHRNPNARLIYLTAERFMYSFAEALRSKDALEFKRNLRDTNLLLIDDMEFLQGKQTKKEFGHTLNELIDAGKQIVVAGDRAPSHLDGLDARMRSRLAGGLVLEMATLDQELRLQILRRRAQEEEATVDGFRIPDLVLEFLAAKLTESGRELEGAITRLRANYEFDRKQNMEPRPITLESAEEILRDLMRGAEPKRVRIDDILRIVTKHYGVAKTDILSERRTRSIVRPRQIGMYLSKKLTSRSLPEIGRRFGGRDHTTVIHAIRKVKELMNGDPGIREEIELLQRLLRD